MFRIKWNCNFNFKTIWKAGQSGTRGEDARDIYLDLKTDDI